MHLSPDKIRARFAAALSDMYRREVPHYETLLELVADTNVAAAGTKLGDRLAVERHGAIRLGRPEELRLVARLFAVMGMFPVGYYDLSPAGVPVHATVFRPVEGASLAANPFRVFTSLLRLEAIADRGLRAEAEAILAARSILGDTARVLVERAECGGGLTETDADALVRAALETFRWHDAAVVDAATYARLRACHALIADVVAFRGPHLNHLTPRTLDIDAVHAAMPARGLAAKEAIEGPPRRRVPILLRQTSFRAIAEPIRFGDTPGTHTARFGEVEQRGAALTRRGRALYDVLCAEGALSRFPDDVATLMREELAFFGRDGAPITYEDFLPVSAAGIFRSNLAGEARALALAPSDRGAFAVALGAAPADEFALYEAEAAA